MVIELTKKSVSSFPVPQRVCVHACGIGVSGDRKRQSQGACGRCSRCGRPAWMSRAVRGAKGGRRGGAGRYCRGAHQRRPSCLFFFPATGRITCAIQSGKTSLVNSLLRKRALPIYTLSASSPGPTTTALPQEVTLETSPGTSIRLIDVPGLFWKQGGVDGEQAETTRARDILLRNKGRLDKLKDPAPVSTLLSHSPIHPFPFAHLWPSP